MEASQIAFNGSIPQAYEEYLGSFLFEPFAEDLSHRIDHVNRPRHTLELACGTGRVTRHLKQVLGKSDLLTATDINPDMLAIARSQLAGDNILWNIIDMESISYSDELFDLVVCQFGLMLVANKEKALSEILRVMNKQGRLIFNVWGNKSDNGIWAIGMKVIGSFLGGNPMPKETSPFSMENENEGVRLLKQAGFRDIRVYSVKKTGVAVSAAAAAKGFIEGLPIANMLMQRDPSLIFKIEEALTKELSEQFGDGPLNSPLHAWVFEAAK